MLQDSDGPTAEYVLTGGEGYVRATCEADRPAYPGASVPLRAWLQPVWETG